MEIVKVEYVCDTEEAMYCKVTVTKPVMNWCLKTLSHKQETFEVYINKFREGSYSHFPCFSKNGKRFEIGMNGYETLRNLMLRAKSTKGVVNI